MACATQLMWGYVLMFHNIHLFHSWDKWKNYGIVATSTYYVDYNLTTKDGKYQIQKRECSVCGKEQARRFRL